ncbi:OLC1v1035191C2 [Oldenlandia corymbosa var. corymbosa]|uniref:OLC1v1035191C2 n=1 Tax=Oldenlandia corymbosa var. corymbosa TaxID=529605 RepID=A0AAV1CT77_OLDCO|nr:OLC1v1035191C2 [Oldenlandia corymbosa var. corymbosa]
MTIATACMFLAAKVEETPRALRDVILVSYEILHNKDPEAMKRIKQVEAVYKEEKEKLLVSETLVMATLGFDLHVRHPYKYLVEGMKKLKISRNEFAQVAWNLVSDGLHTSLYLQFEPRFIAAASIYLAARFLKVDFPSHWWKDFDVSPAQLEEISDQMMELYEQNSGQIPQSSQASEAECSSTAVRTPPRLPSRGPGNTNEERYKDDERGLGNGVEFGADFTVSTSGKKSATKKSKPNAEGNIILNPNFDDGLNNWTGKGCEIMLHDSMDDGKIIPKVGKFFVSTIGRTDTGHGIQQELTGRVQRKLAYEVNALVRIYGNNVKEATVQVTLWLQAADLTEQYIGVASVSANDSDWAQMQGKFLINGFPSRLVIFLEGPLPGTEILLNSLTVKHAAKTPSSTNPPSFQVSDYGVNVVTNSNLNNGTYGWFPIGCTLGVGNGSPVIVPPMAEQSLRPRNPQPLSGRYIIATNRTQTWMGPAQVITGKIKLYMTYQVSAWIRIGPRSAPVPQLVNAVVLVDGQWFNGGYLDIKDADTWHEIGGSFRIEKEPSNVMFYVQGPDAGVDLMVAGLQIFGVNRRARFSFLKEQTDKVRKRDVILKVTGSNPGAKIKVKQIQNSYPFGAAVRRSSIDNEEFVAFFLKYFTWAVFENEIKWFYTEPQPGKLNYKDADELLSFCTIHNIQIRGHCIFWEDPNSLQYWVRELSNNDLMSAVQNRLTGLVTRYKGKFQHYDVNNEMLHGSFFKDRLGNSIRGLMYKETNQLDPFPALFVNDFHIEDGGDYLASPEKYIDLILDLQKQGAPVDGIGLQGHIDYPVGSIFRSALNKLAILGLPIWITELDVSSENEYIRAEDLEVMLREAFAHPAVDGILLWGFWELLMSRPNAYLVYAEGGLNAAGRTFVALREEWLTNANGKIDGNGQFSFRGYQGSYQLEISSGFLNPSDPGYHGQIIMGQFGSLKWGHVMPLNSIVDESVKVNEEFDGDMVLETEATSSEEEMESATDSSTETFGENGNPLFQNDETELSVDDALMIDASLSVDDSSSVVNEPACVCEFVEMENTTMIVNDDVDDDSITESMVLSEIYDAPMKISYASKLVNYPVLDELSFHVDPGGLKSHTDAKLLQENDKNRDLAEDNILCVQSVNAFGNCDEKGEYVLSYDFGNSFHVDPGGLENPDYHVSYGVELLIGLNHSQNVKFCPSSFHVDPGGLERAIVDYELLLDELSSLSGSLICVDNHTVYMPVIEFDFASMNEKEGEVVLVKRNSNRDASFVSSYFLEDKKAFKGKGISHNLPPSFKIENIMHNCTFNFLRLDYKSLVEIHGLDSLLGCSVSTRKTRWVRNLTRIVHFTASSDLSAVYSGCNNVVVSIDGVNDNDLNVAVVIGLVRREMLTSWFENENDMSQSLLIIIGHQYLSVLGILKVLVWFQYDLQFGNVTYSAKFEERRISLKAKLFGIEWCAIRCYGLPKSRFKEVLIIWWCPNTNGKLIFVVSVLEMIYNSWSYDSLNSLSCTAAELFEVISAKEFASNMSFIDMELAADMISWHWDSDRWVFNENSSDFIQSGSCSIV